MDHLEANFEESSQEKLIGGRCFTSKNLIAGLMVGLVLRLTVRNFCPFRPISENSNFKSKLQIGLNSLFCL